MFLPLPFWIKLGDLALAPSRRRHLRAPLPPLSDDVTASIVGPELCQPFVPNPRAIEAYRGAAAIADSLYLKSGSSEEIMSLTNQVLQTPNAEVRRKVAEFFRGQKPITEIEEYLAVPEWQCPVDIDQEMDFPELVKLKQLCLLLQLYAADQWVKGDEREALAYLSAASRLATRIHSCGGMFIHELVSSSCWNRVCRWVRSGLWTQRCTDSFLIQLDAMMAPDAKLAARMKTLFEQELRFAVLPSIRLRGTPWEPVKKRDLSSPYLQASHAQQVLIEWTFRNHPNPFDRKQTLTDATRGFSEVALELAVGGNAIPILQRLADEFGSNVPRPYRAVMFDSLVGIPPTDFMTATAKLLRLDNACGRLNLHKLFDMAGQILASAYRTEAERSAARISIALARHRARGGKGPLDSLYSLVHAGLLDAIPNDPTSSLPFRLDHGSQSIWIPGPKNMTFEQADANRKNGAWIWSLPVQRA